MFTRIEELSEYLFNCFMMKKIAFFITSFNSGGLERVFINYANALTNYSEVFIISCVGSGELLSDVDSKVKIRILEGRLRNIIFKLWANIHKEKYDIVISGGDSLNCLLVATSFFLCSRTKIFISQHNYDNVEMSRLGVWSIVRKKMMKIFYPHANSVIAVSDGIKDYLINNIKVPSNLVTTIYNGIDLSVIQNKSNTKIDYAMPKDYIVFVGRFSVVKNIYLLLDAFNLISNTDIHLVLVGDGELFDDIQRYASNLSKNKMIHFVGSVSNPYPYIKGARGLVLSSLSEAFSMVVLEALALNVPVLTTPTKGPSEILSGTKGGFICSHLNDYRVFSEGINTIISWPKMDYRDVVEKYTLSHSVKKLLSLVE